MAVADLGLGAPVRGVADEFVGARTGQQGSDRAPHRPLNGLFCDEAKPCSEVPSLSLTIRWGQFPPLVERNKMLARRNRTGAWVLALLCGPSGATIATITRSTGWQPHTVRAFLAAVVRKKLGLRLESEKTDGERVYRIVAGKASGDAMSVPSAATVNAEPTTI